MKGKISKILIGVDGSRSSMNAAYYAIMIAEKFNSQIYIIHAAYPVDIEKAKKNVNRWFKKVSTHIDDRSINKKIKYKTDLVVSPSPVIDSILEYANKNKIDHIIVGSSRKTGVKRLLLGSTSSGIVSRAKSTVTVVK